MLYLGAKIGFWRGDIKARPEATLLAACRPGSNGTASNSVVPRVALHAADG